MSSIPVNLAIEDRLSEAVLRRLLHYSARGYAVGTVYGRTGFGYLRKTVCGWNRAARGIPFVILTDLDEADCAPGLIRDWLKPDSQHPNLLFRVAVREVEAWLLSDPDHLADYLRVRRSRMPTGPDNLVDPKMTLVDLARTSRSADVRARIVPRTGSTAKQGPDYNACLTGFVTTSWTIEEARMNSPSLNRMVSRLAAFTPVWI